MWLLKNRTPYAAGRNWTRGKRGEHHWIVAVKATFVIAPDGSLSLADEQSAPALAPSYHGKPGASSLRYDSDLLAVAPGTDVIVNGSAHAPNGRPATTVPVSLRVESVHKTLVVYGQRVYYAAATGVGTTAPRPFTTAPIVYESAFGGADTVDPDPHHHRIDARNPVGRGFAVRPSHLVDQLAHSIEYVAGDAAGVGPAGFGAIDRSWSPRLEWAGTYDAAWAQRKKPLLPDDYDERHALASPVDQRSPTYLRGGERMEVVNMTATGTLRFDLPRIGLGFSTRFGARAEEHASRLRAIILEPDAMRLMMVWQTSLLVPAKHVEELDHTIIKEKRYLG